MKSPQSSGSSTDGITAKARGAGIVARAIHLVEYARMLRASRHARRVGCRRGDGGLGLGCAAVGLAFTP
jgi:hypothetical protein